MSTFIDPYVYPGTDVLRNSLDILDPATLAEHEAQVTTIALAQLGFTRIDGAYDLAHLQAFHRYIFGLVFPWAGEIRTIAIAKQDLFALPQHIESFASAVFGELAGEDHLKGLERDEFVHRLTHYLAEINAMHPFREGNGRTQRAFLSQLAGDAGYDLTWELLDAEENIEASRASHAGDDSLLEALLDRMVSPRG